MAITHAMASGIGGMRTAGDLVARMQMTRRMKNRAAKAYVADKLGVSVSDLTDAAVMGELRADLNMGSVYSHMGSFKGLEAKRNIAAKLGVDINCLTRFKQRWQWSG